MEQYLYRKKAIDFLLGRNVSMLMSGKGLENKAVILHVIRELVQERFLTESVLVVSSSQAILGCWREKLEKWDHQHTLRTGFIHGSDAEKKRLLERKADLYFITHDGLAWFEKTGIFPFTHVVVDQFGLYSNPKSARFKRFQRFRRNIQYLVVLSSLGAMNRPLDLWAQMYLLDGGERLEERRAGFLERYFFYTGSGENKDRYCDREMKQGAAERIRRNLSDICFMSDAEYALAAEYRRCCNAYVTMDGKEYSKYKMVGQEMLPEFGEKAGSQICTEAVMIRRMQVANGILYGNNGEIHRIHERKTEELKRLLMECMGVSVVIVHWFRHEREVIREKVQKLCVAESEGDIRRWKIQKGAALLVSAAEWSKRSNISVGAEVIIWFSLPWDTGLYERVNEELANGKNATVYRILTRNTIDEELAENISNRAEQRKKLAGIRNGGS